MGLMHVSFLLAVDRSSRVEIPRMTGGFIELHLATFVYGLTFRHLETERGSLN